MLTLLKIKGQMFRGALIGLFQTGLFCIKLFSLGKYIHVSIVPITEQNQKYQILKQNVTSRGLKQPTGLIQSCPCADRSDDNRWINCVIEIKTTLPSLSHITSQFIRAWDILTG